MKGLVILLRRSLRALRNVRRVAREQSLFKAVFVLLFAGSFVVGLWALFLEGFDFLESLGGMGLMIIHRLFALSFFGMGAMLVLSSVITSYTSFYRSDEVPYLLLQPLPLGQVILYKYLESALFSSWAFFFIIVPFVGAYAWHERLSVFFSLWTFLFSIPFVLLCSGLGSVVAFALVRWMPRGRPLVATVVVLLAAVGWAAWRGFVGSLGVGEETTVVLSRLIPGLRLASYPLWPSWWVSEGIMALSRGQWARGGLLWGVLVSNTLLVVLLVEGIGRAWFYDGWQRVLQAAGVTRRRGVLFRPLERALGFLPRDVRAVIIKDIRTFFRDPTQWVQGLFFFGLLGLYFLNLRSLRYHTLPAEWRNVIAFLNVFSVSAVLCSFGSRFVYPQLSLEGHSFWVLGLAPTSMGRILLAKFGLALTGMLAVSLGLMLICVGMLNVEAAARWISLGLAAAVACAVAGLSTGLGAVFLDLKQRNPSVIVSGFGGTLNLVLSLGFIILAMLPFGFVFHLRRLQHVTEAGLQRALWLAAAWLVVLTVVTAATPLVLGRRSLMRREY
ncbi:MAG: hypothetical protein JXB04_03655 [Kiritimatiellae bacterium]|nr:hypothetical protein [Kiritimatiellia bacterium]